MVTLRHASLEEREKSYEWYLNIGVQDTEGVFITGDIYDWEVYKADFKDFYFEKAGRNKGSVMIIESEGEDVGCVCYTCFHLRPHAAELDIWLKDETVTGKGLGTQALKALVKYLHHERGITHFIIRPNRKNVRAVQAYKKTGFRLVSDERSVISAYMKPQYIEVYGEEDSANAPSLLMIMEIE